MLGYQRLWYSDLRFNKVIQVVEKLPQSILLKIYNKWLKNSLPTRLIKNKHFSWKITSINIVWNKIKEVVEKLSTIIKTK